MAIAENSLGNRRLTEKRGRVFPVGKRWRIMVERGLEFFREETMSSNVAAPLMISVSGVRGIIGATLTPQVAVEFGQAFGRFLRETAKEAGAKPKVAIGRDTRPSGP